MGILSTILLLLTLLPAYYLACIYQNYRVAKKLKIPIVILPFDNVNPFWLLCSPSIHRLLTRLGFPNVLRLGYLGFDYYEKAAPFVENRCNAFIQVTPGANWISLADPAAVTQIYQGERRGEIARPSASVKVLDVFGPNISTASGADWQRMRRITAASFNEKSNRVVWTESIRQAEAMLRGWLAAGHAGTRSTADDTRRFAMNVLMLAGFGKQYDFDSNTASTLADRNPAKVMDYRQAMNIILENAILIIGLGPQNLSKLSFLSKKLATLSTAVDTFQQYMVETLEQGHKERHNFEARGNFLEGLVRALHEDKQLSQAEVFGNQFVYTFGGHDTTAHSLAFTFMLLSIHPEVQEWMREELRRELHGEDPMSWNYEDHTRLKRTLAVQFETMRLYNPLLAILKGVPVGRTFPISFDGGKSTVTVPGGTNITLNINAIHAHPDYWGEDAAEWRPSRWIQADENGAEHLLVPEKGVFQAWSEGLRVCPGKKFGQVEHLALMSAVFRDHAVEAATETGETVAQTRERIMGVVKDSGMVLNVSMFHPEKARLVWKTC